MSTQQQINQYNAVIADKTAERNAQETILRVQREEFAKAENARSDAELALQRAQNSGASAAQIETLQRQVRQAEQAESDANIAAGQTQNNISSLDGSIRYNTSQRDQFQSSLPAQGVAAGTAADQPVNAATNAAQIAPAPLPAASAPGAVENIGAGRFGLDAPEQRAEIITPALLPPSLVDGFAIPTPVTGIIREPGVIPNLELPNFGINIPSFGVVLLPAPPDAIERGDQTPPPGVSAPAPVSPAADPYSGLTPAQIEFLGNADPTDPFIRARGGLPPLIQPVNVTAPAPVAGAPGLLDPQQQAQIITPAPAPVAGAPGLLDPQQQAAARIAAPEPVRDFVIDPNTGEFVATDSAQAEEIRAEQNRVQTDAPAPVPRSAIEEGGDAEAQEALTIQNTTAESVPLTDAESAALFEQAEANTTIQNTTAESVPLTDAESAALFEQAEANEQVQVNAPEPVAEPTGGSPAEADSGVGVAAPEPVAEPTGGSPAEADPGVGVAAPAPVAGSTQPGLADPAQRGEAALTPEQRAANEQAAAKANTINQATLNSVYKKAGSEDWRVRLQLAPSSNYLYNAAEPGILGPLTATNGVIFPYTPAINTSYKANYEQYDLVHSNYRGVYYKNSRVDDLQIRGIFTAQDTNEANYLLAVIHFFRSVTKMFYGKDEQRGSPPPLVFLSGFGMNQFYGHPCVVTSFAYNLPDSVDYIRATSVNNYGTDLLSRRTASSPSSAAGLGAVGNRLLNAGLANFTATPPAPSSVVASVNNIQLANYVPTKMDIDITLIPVQTRSQVSKQFSLKGFANGDLIKGGFW